MSAAVMALMELPAAFVVFERAAGVEAMNRRTGELYAWARKVGVCIVEDMAAWYEDAYAERPAALQHAINACHLERAALLVHDVAIVSPERLIVGAVLRELAPRELWTPEGRVVVNHFGDVAVVGLPGSGAR